MTGLEIGAIAALLGGQAIQGSLSRAAQAKEAERMRTLTGLGEAMGMEQGSRMQQQEASGLALKDYINSLRTQLGG